MEFTPFKLNLFLFRHIPIAWIAGIRVKEIDDSHVLISLKHSWLNQNPFRSVYFGVLLMAGELSTGIPLFRFIRKNKLNMSMLVIKNQAFFYRKATGKILFEFNNFDMIENKISEAEKTGQPVEFTLSVQAKNEQREVIGKFDYTWSIKMRNRTQA